MIEYNLNTSRWHENWGGKPLTDNVFLLYAKSLKAVWDDDMDLNEFKDWRIEFLLCNLSVWRCFDFEYHNTATKDSNKNANTIELKTAMVSTSCLQLNTFSVTLGSEEKITNYS